MIKQFVFYMEVILVLSSFINNVSAQETKQIFLSGKDFEHPAQWDFKVNGGQNSGKWSTINVPSQWELEGFGDYTYGRWYMELKQDEPSKEEGFYKYSFKVPKEYKNQKVLIKFGGVMTDTEVKVNGKSAGPRHRGGFYEFDYDISSLVDYSGENRLEVHVYKHSDNKSVNAAERKADWWLFGGIYRPVWLEIYPQSNISHVAIDAKMDGALAVDLDLENIPRQASSIMTLTSTANGEKLGTHEFNLDKGDTHKEFEMKWSDIQPWSPENPNLYILRIDIADRNGTILHTVENRIGFRTIEFKRRDGIYVNGKKIIMKGINRHSFWPESGRSLSKRINLMDAELIKDMNMNAVRFHYPPDSEFLNIADSLGLFVLDELAGWHDSYDTEVGKKLIKEMVNRDVNHPSIIIWNNGNEGGWNNELNDEFQKYDPQKRIVIHPWADYDGWDTHHYPNYQTGVHRFSRGENVFFPTEFMHSLYDEGGGAGLRDFWNRFKESPLFAGGFIWALVDEAVKRTDWDGERKYDSKGNLGPDGVVGPHREKEGSYFAIKEIWAPIQFKEPKQITRSFDGKLAITNEYIYTNLSAIKMEYRVKSLDKGALYSENSSSVVEMGEIKVPDIKPHETRYISIPIGEDFFKGDWLEITATDIFGKEIYTWTWKIHHADYYAEKLMKKGDPAEVEIEKGEDFITLKGGDVEVWFNKSNGEIQKVKNKKNSIPFINGPRPVGMKAKLKDVVTAKTDSTAVLKVLYEGGINDIKWIMHDDGRLKMEATMLKNKPRSDAFDEPVFGGGINLFGLTFDFSEKDVDGIKWFGKGPYRVWKNRTRGVEFNVWNKEYNNTITGESFENLIYPEFKGYHSNFIAGKVCAGDNSFRVFSGSDKMFLRLFTPEDPRHTISGNHAMPEFPKGDISFLYEIPGIKSFKPIEQQGPNSQPTNIRINYGDTGIKMYLWFDFKNYQ